MIPVGFNLTAYLQRVEYALMTAAMKQAHYVQADAARLLGMPRMTFVSRLNRHLEGTRPLDPDVIERWRVSEKDAMQEYTPSFSEDLPHPMDQSGCPFPSAWTGLEKILPALLKDFTVYPGRALEFGVQHGFSTAALANCFREVTGVDTFAGDAHAGFHDPAQTLAATAARLKPFRNLTLVQADWRDFATKRDACNAQALVEVWDLIHVDIFHTFDQTYACGRWAVAHSDCVIFHDTASFPEVARAVAQLAAESGRTFYNFSRHYGLGILREGR